MCKWCVNDAKKACLLVLRLSTPARTCPNHLLHPLQNYQPVTRWIPWMTELWYRQKCYEMLLHGWACSEHRRQHCDSPRYGGYSTVRIHDHEVTCCSACDTVAISIRPWWYQWQCCQVYHKVLYLILSGKMIELPAAHGSDVNWNYQRSITTPVSRPMLLQESCHHGAWVGTVHHCIKSIT